MYLDQNEIHPFRKFDGQQITFTIRFTNTKLIYNVDCLAKIYYLETAKIRNVLALKFENTKFLFFQMAIKQ